MIKTPARIRPGRDISSIPPINVFPSDYLYDINIPHRTIYSAAKAIFPARITSLIGRDGLQFSTAESSFTGDPDFRGFFVEESKSNVYLDEPFTSAVLWHFEARPGSLPFFALPLPALCLGPIRDEWNRAAHFEPRPRRVLTRASQKFRGAGRGRAFSRGIRAPTRHFLTPPPHFPQLPLQLRVTLVTRPPSVCSVNSDVGAFHSRRGNVAVPLRSLSFLPRASSVDILKELFRHRLIIIYPANFIPLIKRPEAWK